MVAQGDAPQTLLRPVRKSMSGNRFLVKEDLKLIFIDPAWLLIHIHARRSAARVGSSRSGRTLGQTPQEIVRFKKKEETMTRHSSQQSKEPVLHLSICLIGVFLLIFALRAHGQQVHQLSYNGSSWMDQNLNGAPASPYTGIASFLTTPNDQTHVYYIDHGANYDVEQLFLHGVSWL